MRPLGRSGHPRCRRFDLCEVSLRALILAARDLIDGTGEAAEERRRAEAQGPKGDEERKLHPQDETADHERD